MNKEDALKTYFSARVRIKHAAKRICSEVWEMAKAWKKNSFAPDTSELNGLSDPAFIEKYEENFYKTVQHEGAEAIEELVLFFEAHGVNILEYLSYLERYRTLTGEKPIKEIVAISEVEPTQRTIIVVP